MKAKFLRYEYTPQYALLLVSRARWCVTDCLVQMVVSNVAARFTMQLVHVRADAFVQCVLLRVWRVCALRSRG
jgi:hypothetical protein